MLLRLTQCALPRDSSTAVFSHEGSKKVGVIESFIRVYDCVCECKCDCKSEVFAKVKTLEISESLKTLVDGITVPNSHVYKET